MTRLLLQNAFPLGGLRSTHILSLDALLTVIDTIDRNCASRQADALNFIIGDSNISKNIQSSITISSQEAAVEKIESCTQIRPNRMAVSVEMPTMCEIIDRKKQKQIVTEGTEIFNSNPNKGIEFLSEKGILQNPLVPNDVANWLRLNPRLDKNKIAEYICK